MLGACGRHTEWPARSAAGIHAALDFAIANPAVARALTIESRLPRSSESRGYWQMIEHFSELLGEGAPRKARLPASTDEALVGGVATVVGGHLLSGRMDRLEEISSELVYFVLLPYLGFAEAKRWTESLAPFS